jgi:hypothetical protein
MKKEYNIKDRVWIHIGERKLTQGRIVEIIDFAHLNENHADIDHYVIEIKTGIDDIYEVRTFEQISPDSKGPIGIFRELKAEMIGAKRYLKKVGVDIPIDGPNPLVELVKEIDAELAGQEYEEDEPTTEQIHAAMEAAEKAQNQIFQPTLEKPKRSPRPKRKPFNKRKKNDA